MKSLSKNLLTLVLAIIFLGILSPINAQKSIQELAEFKDKKWDKLVHSHKSGFNNIIPVEGLLGIEVLK